MACVECGALTVHEIPKDVIWYGTDGKTYIEHACVCDPCLAKDYPTSSERK